MRAKGNDFASQLDDLEKRHFEIVKALLEIRDQNPALTRLKINFNQLEELLQGILYAEGTYPKIPRYGAKLRRAMLDYDDMQDSRPVFSGIVMC